MLWLTPKTSRERYVITPRYKVHIAECHLLALAHTAPQPFQSTQTDYMVSRRDAAPFRRTEVRLLLAIVQAT